MKAIIPVAGAGTKLRPLTYTQPKALIPIAGKTILSVIVDQLLDAGVKEFVFVIGYLGEKIQDYVALHYPHLDCVFVNQNDRKGTGHAIGLTKDAIGADEIIIVLGDTICDYDFKKILASDISLIGVQKVDDPRNFGVAELIENDRVLHVVEKPLIPKSNMAMVGIYFIKETKLLFESIETLLSSEQESLQEFSLTNALDDMITHKNVQFDAFRVNTWFDCGKKETLLTTNATLLKNNDHIDTDITLNDTVIIHPVSIAKGCKIKNSIIGPNVTIGEATKIEFSIIKNSIIGSYAELEDVLMHESIIGNDAFVRGSSQSLNIGDNTEIDLR